MMAHCRVRMRGAMLARSPCRLCAVMARQTGLRTPELRRPRAVRVLRLQRPRTAFAFQTTCRAMPLTRCAEASAVGSHCMPHAAVEGLTEHLPVARRDSLQHDWESCLRAPGSGCVHTICRIWKVHRVYTDWRQSAEEFKLHSGDVRYRAPGLPALSTYAQPKRDAVACVSLGW